VLEEIVFVCSSSTSPGQEFTSSGIYICVMFTKGNQPGKPSKFLMKFHNDPNSAISPNGRNIYPTTVLTDEGNLTASFPLNREENYAKNSNHFMLLAPLSGRRFSLYQSSAGFVSLGDGKGDYAQSFHVEDHSTHSSFVQWKHS